jgi:hypothetical protein
MGDNIKREVEEIDQNRDFLEVFVDKCLHQAMGKSLDLFRISEISDRSMEQVKRSLKDYYNELITHMIKTLKEKGYIKEK